MEVCSRFHASTSSPSGEKPVNHWTQRCNQTPYNRVLDKLIMKSEAYHLIRTSHWVLPSLPSLTNPIDVPTSYCPMIRCNAGCARSPRAPLQEGCCTVRKVSPRKRHFKWDTWPLTRSPNPLLICILGQVLCTLIHWDFIFPTRVVGFVAHLALPFDSKVGLTTISSLQIHELQFRVHLSQACYK